MPNPKKSEHHLSEQGKTEMGAQIYKAQFNTGITLFGICEHYSTLCYLLNTMLFAYYLHCSSTPVFAASTFFAKFGKDELLLTVKQLG
jgi:hypothetical protein